VTDTVILISVTHVTKVLRAWDARHTTDLVPRQNSLMRLTLTVRSNLTCWRQNFSFRVHHQLS